MAAGSLSSFCARSLFILPSQKLRCFCTQGDSHTIHVPVMLKECLSFLAPRDGQVSHEIFTAGYGRFVTNQAYPSRNFLLTRKGNTIMVILYLN